MTGLELSTAARYGMAPIVFILNNDGYGTQRMILDGSFNDIHAWDYTRVTEVIRAGQATTVETQGQLDGALTNALSTHQLSIIEIRLPRDDCSPALRHLGEELAHLRNPKGRTTKSARRSAAKEGQGGDRG